MLFIGNRVTGENGSIPTNDQPMSSGDPIGDDFDHESQTEFMKSFNTIKQMN